MSKNKTHTQIHHLFLLDSHCLSLPLQLLPCGLDLLSQALYLSLHSPSVLSKGGPLVSQLPPPQLTLLSQTIDYRLLGLDLGRQSAILL